MGSRRVNFPRPVARTSNKKIYLYVTLTNGSPKRMSTQRWVQAVKQTGHRLNSLRTSFPSTTQAPLAEEYGVGVTIRQNWWRHLAVWKLSLLYQPHRGRALGRTGFETSDNLSTRSTIAGSDQCSPVGKTFSKIIQLDVWDGHVE